MSTSQFAAIYGQSQSNISQLQAYLAHFGITTQVYADHVDVVANGTAGDFDRALSVQQHEYHVPALPSRGGVPGIRA
ncbi:MAG: protease pro-enzyme activation domain-containing protein [Candidatus Dormibacteria bacterium]